MAYPEITQPWYADDSVSLGEFDKILLYFILLKQFGPGCGYYPKPSKIVLVVHRYDIKNKKEFVLHHGFKVYTGAQYLGGFIENEEFKWDWLKY